MSLLIAAFGGVLATLIGVFVAERVGVLQIRWMRQAHELNVKRATAKIGTNLRIEERNVLGTGYSSYFYLITEIYNEGELPACDLNGKWQLASPNKTIAQEDIPIFREFLGSTPRELEPIQIRSGIFEPAMRSDVRGKDVAFNVNIEFDYVSSADDKPHHYSAKYEFSHECRKMVRVHSWPESTQD